LIKNIAIDMETKNNDFHSKLDQDIKLKFNSIENTKLNKSEFTDISSKVKDHNSKIDAILD